MGFLVNVKKFNLRPIQKPRFLGTVLDLEAGIAVPSPERVTALALLARSLSLMQGALAILWLKVLGGMASMVDLVPWCRFHMRPIQIRLLALYSPSSHPVSRPVPMSDYVRKQLMWWTSQANLSQGVVFPPPPVKHVITTDASLTGWGGHLNDQVISGTWSFAEAQQHINILEMLAVQRTVQHFRDAVRDSQILIQTDNSTVVAYLNKEGGTRSSLLCAHTLRFLMWCQNHFIRVRAVHIAGITNVLADDLSRGTSTAPTECMLAPHIVQTLCNRWFCPTIDLFATALNKQLPVYCSRHYETGALAADALSIDWAGMTAYAFPPLVLLNLVVGKISREDCRVIFIAPFWPQHLWFRPLVDLLAGVPVLLSLLPDLLRGVEEGEVPLSTENLKLTAWPLSGLGLERQVFRRGLLYSYPAVGGTPPLELR